jgi:hypothetical protein
MLHSASLRKMVLWQRLFLSLWRPQGAAGMGNFARFVKNVIYHARFAFCVISRITQSHSKFQAFWVSAGTRFFLLFLLKSNFSQFLREIRFPYHQSDPSRDLIGDERSDIPSPDTDSVLEFSVSHWFARSGLPCYMQGT